MLPASRSQRKPDQGEEHHATERESTVPPANNVLVGCRQGAPNPSVVYECHDGSVALHTGLNYRRPFDFFLVVGRHFPATTCLLAVFALRIAAS